MRELLNRVRTQRETQIYPALWGNVGREVHTFDEQFFQRTFQQAADPHWLLAGVIECAPSEKHSDWVYVSSGLSNPLEGDSAASSPDDFSWLGVEVMFRSTERGPWAIELVQRVAAFEILLAYERFPGRDRLAPGARIPLGGPMIPNSDSQLKWLLVVPPMSNVEHFDLESGRAEFLNVVGITDGEAKFAREQGAELLFEQLRNHGALWVTDPRRGSLVAD
ncbi:MAG: suppressor of fused domain protein [Myxococcota bacterium]